MSRPDRQGDPIYNLNQSCGEENLKSTTKSIRRNLEPETMFLRFQGTEFGRKAHERAVKGTRESLEKYGVIFPFIFFLYKRLDFSIRGFKRLIMDGS